MRIIDATKLLFCFLIVIIFTGCTRDLCSMDLMESVKSPNEEYTIKTYLKNCGATVDCEVVANLCDKNDKCKKIYSGYHENVSFVYWIDNDNVYINQKTLNIYKDKYIGYDYEDAFMLYGNIEDYKEMYLIDKAGNEYKLNKFEVEYIDEMSTSVFTFNKDNSFNDSDFTFKIVDLENKTANEYLLKIDYKKMYLLDGNKMSELNKTDCEYMKKILTTNKLYDFS